MIFIRVPKKIPESVQRIIKEQGCKNVYIKNIYVFCTKERIHVLTEIIISRSAAMHSPSYDDHNLNYSVNLINNLCKQTCKTLSIVASDNVMIAYYDTYSGKCR